MSDEQRKRDPSTTSAAYNAMVGVWEKTETILAGTEAMRAAGERYLPRHENEKRQRYADRLESTTLDNVSCRTLDSWVGRPFSDPVVIGEDVPPPIVEDLDNINLQGDNITVFGREWFREGLSKAFAHVLVDHPIPRGDPATRTKADDRAEGLRPYWSLIKPENLIFAAAEVIDGTEVLVHIRIREVETVRDGFAEGFINRIRIFDRVLGETEEESGVFFSTWIETKGDGERRWIPEIGPTKISIPVIPLVTFYANREGLMIGKPPLEDLVDLNIEHWQSSSDQRSILTMGRFPMLAASGVDSDEAKKILVGPKAVLTTETPSSKWYYVETTAKAIEAGAKDLERIQVQMGQYGANFLRKRPNGETATARVLDSAEESSPLQDATIRFEDAMNQAMALSAMWRSLEESGSLTVSNDFGPEDFFPGDMDTLTKARGARDLSRENYLGELKRRGALTDEFDIDENQEQLDKEMTDSLAEAGAGLNIDPQQENPVVPAKTPPVVPPEE